MASHSYLGDKLEAIRSRVFLKEGNEYELLIIPLRNIILFPGDTLPLRLRNRSYIKAVEGLLKGTSTNYLGGMNSVHLGIVNLTDDDEPITSGTVGTTSEVRGHRSQQLSDNRLTGEPDEVEEMIVTAKVCQRFRLLEDPRRVNGVKVARVLILSESIPNFNSVDASKSPFPSWIYRNNSASYLLAKAQKLFEESLWLENSEKMSADKERENDHEFKEDNRLSNKGVPVSMANSDENESGNNVGSIRCPSDPTLAVYYLASNMIVHDKEKQQLLEAENIIIRLRMIIAMLEEHANSEIGCSECGQVLFRKDQLFTVPGASGLVGSYVNSFGYVHNTFTFKSLKPSGNVVIHGIQPTEKDSWFPGYAWRIASCGHCGTHLGWLFTSTSCSASSSPCKAESDRHTGNDDSGINDPQSPDSDTPPRARGAIGYYATEFVKGLSVDYFWGIRRAAIEELKSSESEADEDTEGERGSSDDRIEWTGDDGDDDEDPFESDEGSTEYDSANEEASMSNDDVESIERLLYIDSGSSN